MLIAAMIMAAPNTAEANPKYASIVIDANTGMVLRERYADKKLHPASMTKIMTLYMAFDAMKRGKMNLNTPIRMSEHAASMVPSKLYIKPGQTIRLEDAILALVTKSANDVAAAVGEAISGSESAFAADMTRMARRLGMNSTTFKNASGLHHPAMVSTARDMARLGQAMVHNFPQEYAYFKTNKFTYKGNTYGNHNRLMSSYEGMDGIKTGYVNASGFNLCASAKRDGIRLIGVVFGGRTTASRNAHMAKILDEGFSKAKRIQTVMAAADALPSPKPKSIMLASLQGSQDIQIAQIDKNVKVGGAFPPIGLVVGEGDAEIREDAQVMASLESMARTDGGIRNMPESFETASLNGGRTLRQPVIEDWSVQIGAFSDHKKSSDALRAAARKLPKNTLQIVKPQIITAKTVDGKVYRARFSGLSRDKAIESCRIIKDCIVLASN
tara:strand:+ start:6651 stop:7973 length:1323 start_codon:yes stop_codon:yes gene_type:complete